MGQEKEEKRSGDDASDGGEKATPGVIGGAALIGAGVGAIVSGPLGALVLGAGAAGLCFRDDKAGEVARSTGKAGVAVVDKGKEVNERYHVTDNVKGAAQTTYRRARQLDEKHNITEKTRAAASRTWGSVRNIDKEHRVSERAMDQWSNAMNGVTKAMSGKGSTKGGDGSSTPST